MLRDALAEPRALPVAVQLPRHAAATPAAEHDDHDRTTSPATTTTAPASTPRPRSPATTTTTRGDDDDARRDDHRRDDDHVPRDVCDDHDIVGADSVLVEHEHEHDDDRALLSGGLADFSTPSPSSGRSLAVTIVGVRILFSAGPMYGHVNTLLPLADAARHAGHDVVIATGPDLVPHVAAWLRHVDHRDLACRSRRTGRALARVLPDDRGGPRGLTSCREPAPGGRTSSSTRRWSWRARSRQR